jgi:MFS family permease
MITKRAILLIIVLSQFLCTSLWFAGNAVMPELIKEYVLPASALGLLTSSVQFGFIIGTLIFAIFTLSDRFSPSKVFFVCALLGGATNFASTLNSTAIELLISTRFMTGFFLAGIYPVGMKIAADYHQKGLGKALGYLVGALVLGTAFPHLLRNFTSNLPWRYVLFVTTSLSLIGGILMVFLVPDGPYRKPGANMDFKGVFKVFRDKKFRTAAVGYFGHMWELYAFWAFVPVILITFLKHHQAVELNVSLLSFIIIGVGGVSCVIGGYVSQFIGSRNTAFYALAVSGICCLISPFTFHWGSTPFIIFLLIWGFAVVADSPQFSSLVAQNAPNELKGTALTIVNSIGFAITIVSIQLITTLSFFIDSGLLYTILGIGPLVGLYVMHTSKKQELVQEKTL